MVDESCERLTKEEEELDEGTPSGPEEGWHQLHSVEKGRLQEERGGREANSDDEENI